MNVKFALGCPGSLKVRKLASLFVGNGNDRCLVK